MEIDRRRALILTVLAGLVVGAVVVPTVLGVFQVQNTDDTVSVSGGVPLASPDGTNITVEGSTDVLLEQPYPDAQTVRVETTDGNVTMSGAGQINATIAAGDILGTYTTVSNIQSNGNELTINPEDKQRVTVGKEIERIEFRDPALDDGATDFVYSGPDGTESLVEVSGLSSGTDVRAVDADTGALLDAGTVDSSGTLRLDNLDNSEHAVELQSNTGGPTLDDDSMSPTGTERYETVELSIDVDDPDFPSEEVTLEWFVDGSLENTTTVDSAGTATAEVGPLPDGSHDWSVVATDASGETDTSETKNFEIAHYRSDITDIRPTGNLDLKPTEVSANVSDQDFDLDGDSVSVEIYIDDQLVTSETISQNQEVNASLPDFAQVGGDHVIDVYANDSYGNSVLGSATYTVPNTLFVRNETNHDELIPANGEVRFFGDDEIYTRSTSDGRINMTGLPVDQSFIVEVEPTDSDYLTRTASIDSIYEQQSVYTLNATKYDTVENRFVLNDPTSQFGSQSVLKIKRPIDINGSTTWQTIVADQFGAEGVTATLQEDTRYRLAIADDDSAQTVGPFRSNVAETVEVQPGQPEIDLEDPGSGWVADATLSDGVLEYRFLDPSEETSLLTVYIHERGDPDNLLTGNTTYSNLGEASGKVSLTENQTEQEWVVEFVVDRNGERFVRVDRLSDRQDATPPIDGRWRVMIGMAALILLAGAFSVLNAGIGALVVSLVGALLWWLGWLGGATGGAAVMIAIFVSVLGHIYTRGP